MRKNTVALFLFMSCCLTMNSQQIEFIKTFTGVLGRYSSVCNDMILTSDSCYLLTGASWHHNGPVEHFLIKTDLSGNTIWMVNGPAPFFQETEGAFLLEISNMNYMMLDKAISWPEPGNHLLFYDSSGVYLHDKVINYISDTLLNISSVAEINGSLYVVGSVNLNGISSAGALIKTDLDGNVIQKFWIPDANVINKNQSVVVNNNQLIIAGYIPDTAQNTFHPCITAIDTNGVIAWQYSYPVATNRIGYLISVPDGYLLSSRTNPSTLIKVDLSGIFNWSMSYNFNAHFADVNINFNGNILLTSDGGGVKWLDSTGVHLHSYNGAVPSLNPVKSIVRDDKIIMAGWTWIGIDPESYLVQISDSLLTNISHHDYSPGNVFPNPVCAGGRLHFSLSGMSVENVSLFSMDGKRILNLSDNSVYNDFINLPDGISPGNYIITFNGKNMRKTFPLTILETY